LLAVANAPVLPHRRLDNTAAAGSGGALQHASHKSLAAQTASSSPSLNYCSAFTGITTGCLGAKSAPEGITSVVPRDPSPSGGSTPRASGFECSFEPRRRSWL
jgi:hypothetical protein